ncbi:MAG: polysaccharide deacetylase family protein [Spirochaetaceae bacterium]|nr:MAG: polysaccharide deacetylase family protein [Spirochaetaceae bacterium]
MKRIAVVLSLLLVVSVSYAEVSFGGLDLSRDELLLFSAQADVPGRAPYTALFASDLSRVGGQFSQSVAGGDVLRGVPLVPLTFFPEVMSHVPATGQIQIQNRFGLFRADIATGRFEPVPGYPGFADGARIPQGRILPTLSSPDGRYLLVTEPVSAAYGRLVLIPAEGSGGAAATRRRTIVADRVELSTQIPLVRWSPDSRYFVYGHSGAIYYYSIAQFETDRVPVESFRRLGEGSIASVRWAPDNSLYYLSGSLVYQIRDTEFFTRSLYSGLLQIGTIRGKLPFAYDPNFDGFWIAPTGESILLSKGGRNLFVLFLDTDDFVDAGQVLGLPSLFLPRNTRVRQVEWSNAGDVVVLTGDVSGDDGAAVFRLRLRPGVEGLAFERMPDARVRSIHLSPDQSRIALVTTDGVRLRTSGWVEERFVPVTDPLHAVWIDAQRVVVAGSATIEAVSVSGARTLVGLSQADDHSLLPGGTVVARVGERRYELSLTRRTDSGIAVSAWSASQRTLNPKNTASERFRVFLEALSGSYRTVVMVRRTQGVGTSRLFASPEARYEAFPADDEPVDFDYFTHGSRIRRREVALVFSAIDDVGGLTDILMSLKAYGLRATFFVNGEFIRRHPAAVNEIADAGHEIGSLFFAHFDMADRRFQITSDFIREGLSRNEDEYYAATGRELSLLWHAPYHFVSDEIVSAGRSANYTYVGRDVDSLDWVSTATAERLGQLYLKSADLIERVLAEKRPGSIVSMRVGIPDDGRGTRDDYAFHRLDVLLNGLIERGYRVVPVSTLIENAR